MQENLNGIKTSQEYVTSSADIHKKTCAQYIMHEGKGGYTWKGGINYSFLSRLHAWPRASMQFTHKGSKSTGQTQYLGKRLKMVCFNSHNSLIGNPGSSLYPIGVQSIPKKTLPS